MSLAGNQIKAADRLAEAILRLPKSAAEDGDPAWEAVQRAAFEVGRRIRNALWDPAKVDAKLEPGHISSPGLRVDTKVPGQTARTSLLRADVSRLCACLGTGQKLLQSPAIIQIRESADHLVNFSVSEAQLALSYASGAGGDLVAGIDAFDRSLRVMREERIRGQPPSSSHSNGEPTWFGLLAAGLACITADLMLRLEEWVIASAQVSTELQYIKTAVGEIRVGASSPRVSVRSVLADPSLTAAVRCGAAAKLLVEPRTPEETFYAQNFIVSALASDASYLYQDVCNFHVARHFSLQWEQHALNPFNLPTPRTTVPGLRAAIDGVNTGRASLHLLLANVGGILAQPLGAHLARIR
jgi:hypothetical protein